MIAPSMQSPASAHPSVMEFATTEEASGACQRSKTSYQPQRALASPLLLPHPSHIHTHLASRGPRCSLNVLTSGYRYRELLFRLSLPMPSVSIFAAQITETPRPPLFCTIGNERCDESANNKRSPEIGMEMALPISTFCRPGPARLKMKPHDCDWPDWRA